CSMSLVGLSSMSVCRVGCSWVTIEAAGRSLNMTVVMVRGQPIDECDLAGEVCALETLSGDDLGFGR
ncbi:MAG: hypothetical protein WA322_10605, partial [Pseudolabrys sp.]